MKIQLIVVMAVVMLFISACTKHHKTWKNDKTPYLTKECRKELSLGKEIKGEKIDKIVVHKKERRMYTYSKGKEIGAFRISMGKNWDKGNKERMGDYRTPEGSYRIVRKKCDRRLYKSLMISYPNRADKVRARKKGLNPGGYITIHGQPKWNAKGVGDDYTLANNWTEGCMAVSNEAMDTLWQAVANGVKIEITKE